jgi:hypothetical protein
MVLMSLAFAAAAQDQRQSDKDTQARMRSEGSAGGLGNVTPEQKAGADVGAGPHLERKPGGESKREHQEKPSEREAGRGATRGEALQSGNGRTEPRRP